jgi:hypothetical protein
VHTLAGFSDEDIRVEGYRHHPPLYGKVAV